MTDTVQDNMEGLWTESCGPRRKHRFGTVIRYRRTNGGESKFQEHKI